MENFVLYSFGGGGKIGCLVGVSVVVGFNLELLLSFCDMDVELLVGMLFLLFLLEFLLVKLFMLLFRFWIFLKYVVLVLRLILFSRYVKVIKR